MRTSGAAQLRDLSREFVRQGHDLTVLLPAAELKQPWLLEDSGGIRVLRLSAPKTKDISYLRRTLAEFAMPFAMGYHLKLSPLAGERWDGVVWYAPSIFHGPLAKTLKVASGCKGYLIVRDIFPQWAVDLGLMGRGLPYWFLDAVARYQYSVADVIGVQTPGNLPFLRQWAARPGRRLQVLHNWLDAPAQVNCSIRVADTPLAGRKVFVYAGNMGVAQAMDVLLDLAEGMRERTDVGFLFLGRGSDAKRLAAAAATRGLHNVVFHDEIDSDEIPALLAQCHVGLVALDPRHRTHNIPGKFLSYMRSGLPVLANVNPGNDLAQMIRQEEVGQVCESNRTSELLDLANTLVEQTATDPNLSQRCRDLFHREFSVENTVRQVVAALS